MIVLDAEAWVRALVDAGPAGDACRRVLSDDPDWAAPAHAAIEVLRTIRRYESAGLIDAPRANSHAAAVWGAELRYSGAERWILAAGWGHRHDISPYDAPY
ncbi:MAG: type II toxin-antitoxin system VapC family toxin, partial [Candidatus Dormibacteraceae bacterium]